MPVSQQPTLNTIAPEDQQFEIVFGVEMTSPENRQGIVIPNLGPFIADRYDVSFLNITSPARSNIPAVRSLQFTLRTVMAQPTGVPPQVGNVYIVNAATNQVIALCPPTPGPGFPSVVMGNVPFFIKSNHALIVYRDASELQNVFCFLSVSAFTYDTSSFLEAMTPGPSLFPVGPVAALDVNIVGPNPLPVLVTNPAALFSAQRVAAGADMNTFTTGGIFIGSGLLNGPVAGDFQFVVYPADTANFATQIAWQTNGAAGETIATFTRQLRAGAWSAWISDGAVHLPNFSDMNSTTTAGTFLSIAPTNSPVANHDYHWAVFGSTNPQYCSQICWETDALTPNGQLWTRQQQAGVWSAWLQMNTTPQP
jgi:hypothetical protein